MRATRHGPPPETGTSRSVGSGVSSHEWGACQTPLIASEVERVAQALVESVRTHHTKDLRRLSCEESDDGPVEHPHDSPPRVGAPSRAVSNMTDLVSQDLAVEKPDTGGDFWLVGEERRTGLAEQVEHGATGHLRRPDEGKALALGDEYCELHELAHYESGRCHPERKAEEVQDVSEQPSVVVLLQLHVDSLRQSVPGAVLPIGFP